MDERTLISAAMRALALRKHANESPAEKAEAARKMVAGRQRARRRARRAIQAAQRG